MNGPQIPLLLFSGGLDSTFLLQETLKYSDVETVYVCAAQGEDKIRQELTARKKILDKLNDRYQYRVLEDHIVYLDFDMNTGFADAKWLQPLMWLNGALKVSDGTRHGYLAIGYVSGDSVASAISDIKNAWENLQAFTKLHPIPIDFPLKTVPKHEILAKLDPDLWDDLWICEIPEKKGRKFYRCENCQACHTLSATLHVFERMRGTSYQQFNKKAKKEKQKKIKE